MVKNISNPLNSRKVARIIVDDAKKVGISLSEAKIRLFLSDNQVDNLHFAINQLKDEKTISDVYNLSDECLQELKDNEFIDENSEILVSDSEDQPSYKRVRNHSMQSQLDNLIIKLFKAQSISTHGFDRKFQRFDVYFGKPMKKLIDELRIEKGEEISEMKAFAVIYGAEHLGLRKSSIDIAYHYTFGRFDDIRDFLSDIGVDYEWPVVSGSGFIDIGKKYSAALEIAEFAHNLKSTSGIDTYTDEILQEFFIDFLDGSLLPQILKSKNIWKWQETEIRENPYDWLIPELKYGTSVTRKKMLVSSSITYIILSTIDRTPVSFKDIIDEIKDMPYDELIKYLSVKIEHSLTKKSIELQLGMMVVSYFENLKGTSNERTFEETVIRYYDKFGGLTFLVSHLEHGIKAGLKNSFGTIRKYLKEISNDELTEVIMDIIVNSISQSYNEIMDDELRELIDSSNVIDYMDKIDYLFLKQDKTDISGYKLVFFSKFIKILYDGISVYIRRLEPKEKEKSDGKGGLKELTKDFMSSVKHSASKNIMIDAFLKEEEIDIFSGVIAKEMMQIISYATYQVATKEGKSGEIMFKDIFRYFKRKYIKMANIKVNDTQSLLEYAPNLLKKFVYRDLTQAVVLISLSSKTKANAYNAWTQISSISTKNTLYLNKFLVNNLLFWQRLPKELVYPLLKKDISKSKIKDIIDASGRKNIIEAFSLLIMGIDPDINEFSKAKSYIFDKFDKTDEEVFNLSPKTGEAELINEIIHLWNILSKTKINKTRTLNKFEFSPIELAITLPKGFIHEFKNRKWFDQIYFGKLSMSSEQQGYKPILYKFTINSDENSDIPLPENILLTFNYPEGKSNTQLSGIVIIGGYPNIYHAYQTSKLLTPYLDALLIDKHSYRLDEHIRTIQDTLSLVSSPINIRSALEIYEQTTRKEGEQLNTFYPILGDKEIETFSLPNNFRIDAVFVLGIDDTFFTSDRIGAGLKHLSLYVNNDNNPKYSKIEGYLVYPLVLKWQPVYNDILSQLTKRGTEILPVDFSGYLKPDVIIFEQINDHSYTALIISVTKIDDKLFYNVAIARSGYSDGMPISLLQKALRREKFGQKSWSELFTKQRVISDSNQSTIRLEKVIDKLNVITSEDKFDLGLVLSLRNE